MSVYFSTLGAFHPPDTIHNKRFLPIQLLRHSFVILASEEQRIRPTLSIPKGLYQFSCCNIPLIFLRLRSATSAQRTHAEPLWYLKKNCRWKPRILQCSGGGWDVTWWWNKRFGMENFDKRRFSFLFSWNDKSSVFWSQPSPFYPSVAAGLLRNTKVWHANNFFEKFALSNYKCHHNAH